MILDVNLSTANLLGLACGLALLVVARRWPDPDAAQRLNIRLVSIGVYLLSFMTVGNLWHWIPAAIIVGGLFRAWLRFTKPMVRKAKRLKPRWLKRRGWLIVGFLLIPLLNAVGTDTWPDQLEFHRDSTLLAMAVLSVVHSRRWLANLPGIAALLFPVSLYGFTPGITAFPLAYLLTHTSRGDRRALLVVLVPVLLVGVVNV